MKKEYVNNIPSVMKQVEQWMGYKREKKSDSDKFSNVPKTAKRNQASHSNPNGWKTFDEMHSVIKADKWFNGMSFALGWGFLGFDFDNVRDKETGELSKNSKPLIGKLEDAGAYVEISPSGTGIHAILRWDVAEQDKDVKEVLRSITSAPTGCKSTLEDGSIVEFYLHSKILTTTGQKTERCNYKEEDGSHKAVVLEVLNGLPKKYKPSNNGTGPDNSDSDGNNLTKDEVLEKLFNEKNKKWKDLYEDGDWENHDYESQSSADQALFNKLAFYTARNKDLMIELFERSKLYRGDKGKGYLELTADKSIESCKQVYRKGLYDTNNDVFVSTKNGARKTNESAAEVVKRLANTDPNKSLILAKDGTLGFIRMSDSERELDEFTDQKITQVSFEPFDRESCAGKLNEVFNFKKYNKKGDPYLLEQMPPNVAGQIIKTSNLSGVPTLNGVIEHPYYSKRWELINTPGWHPKTKLYLHESKTFDLVDISITEAYIALCKWIIDFPWKEVSDKMNAIAMLITTLIRPALPWGEMCPVFVITANGQGAGKSTLAKTLTAGITGSDPGSTQMPANEEEVRKAIGSELYEGTEIIVWDNINDQEVVASSSMASAVTEPKVRFRYLTRTKMIETDNNAIHILTGNNVTTNADLVDRSCFIRLDTETRVAERSFQIDNFITYTLKNHQRIFSCANKIVDQWIKDGKNYGDKKHRSFVWAQIQSGILETLKNHLDYSSITNQKLWPLIEQIQEFDGDNPFDEFLNNDLEAKHRADPEFNDIVLFRQKIMDPKPQGGLGFKAGEPFTVAEVFHIGSFRTSNYKVKYDDDNLLGPHFKSGESSVEANRKRGLGIYLRSLIGKPIGRYKIMSGPTKNHGKSYMFVELKDKK